MIFLGNLTVEDIMRRTGAELSQEDIDYLNASRQEEVNHTPLKEGKWHCYDLPFMIMTDTKTTAIKMRDMFQKYMPFKETLQIGWEKE